MHTSRSFPATVATFLVAVALAAAAVFGVAVSSSDAQGQTITCPAGSVPSADGTACVAQTAGGADENVVTTTSCVQGVLSADGTMCLVPRLDAAPADAAAGGAATPAAPIPTFTG